MASDFITGTDDRDVPAFMPIRVDQVGPGAVVLGMIDHEGIAHTFTPDPGFTRTLVARTLCKDRWWRLTFADGYVLESPGLVPLAVTG